jgi:hypothetical protein
VVEGARVFEVRPRPVAQEFAAHETEILSGEWSNHLDVGEASCDAATEMSVAYVG